MNKLEKTLVSGTTGTAFMTAASALMSLLPREEFREPQQLSKLVGRILPYLSKGGKKVAGWSAHLGVGMVFAAIYVDLWEKRVIDHNLKNGLILGAISGLVGMLIWKASFEIHPLPPNYKKFNFYIQRIPAHVIFAVFTTIAYRMINSHEKNNGSISD